MPPFRIHNPKIRSARVLIRTTKGRDVSSDVYETSSSPAAVILPVKAKKKISMRQIQQVIELLQKSKNKNLNDLLQKGISTEDDQDVEIDELSEAGSEFSIEDIDEIKEGDEDEKDVLIIEF